MDCSKFIASTLKKVYETGDDIILQHILLIIIKTLQGSLLKLEERAL